MRWRACNRSRRSRGLRRSLTLPLVALLATGLLGAETRVVEGLSPAFKREYKRDYLRQEKEAAKAYKKSMKRRTAPDCPPTTEWKTPPASYYYYPPGFPTMAMGDAVCTVRFDITAQAVPANIRADCTDPVYVPTSEQAVAKWWFKDSKAEAKAAGGLCGYEMTFRFELPAE